MHSNKRKQRIPYYSRWWTQMMQKRKWWGWDSRGLGRRDNLTWAIELSHTTGWGMCQALNKLMGSEIVTQGTISPSKGSLQRISALMKTEESRAERSVSQKTTEERRDGWWGGRGDKRNRTSQKVLSLLSFWLGEISSWMIGKHLLYPQLQK